MLYLQLGNRLFFSKEGDLHMMHSPIVKWVTVISFWITTIVALNLALVPMLGYNRLEKVLAKISLESLFMPIHYLVGIAGLICLFSLVAHKCCSCHCNE
jgi:uncharacterized membrane protein YuzA (DUF378 family)